MKGPTALSVGLILAAAACCHAQVFSWGPCPAVQVKPDFNATRYFGKWYEILRYNRTSFEEGTRCNYAIYSQGARANTISVMNAGLRGTEVDSAEGVGFAPDPSQPGKLKVRISGSWFAGNYWVLDTDYRTFSMVHSCTGFYLFNFQLSWLLSPSRDVTTDLMTGIVDRFQAAGIETSDFIQTNQTRCPDF